MTTHMPQTRNLITATTDISRPAKSSCSSSALALKPWPAPMIESKGDYREEAYLEDFIGGPLYQDQKELPSLPVPNLENTLSSFLPTALPLAKNEDEAKHLIKKSERFMLEVKGLQEKLIERKEINMSDSSWLQHWWNTVGYLQVRDPIVVNVSYFFHFIDDGTLPILANQSSRSLDGKHLGVLRAASILHSSADFRKQVCSGSYPQQRMGRNEPKTPLCSVAFKYMFNSCRVPHRVQDTYKIYDPSLHKHCIVARKGLFFSVDFLDDVGDALPVQELEERLQKCVILADENVHLPKFGWCTSSDRDSWADARSEMLRIGGGGMAKDIEKIESSALMICLDDEAPVSRKQCGDIFWTGGLSSGHNRWFDKSIQIMCANNGKAGLIGEHSMMDGMPMVCYADHVTRNTYSDAINKSGVEMSLAKGGVEILFQSCVDSNVFNNSKLPEMISKANQHFIQLVSDHELNVQSFQGYGSNGIKKMGYSPDAFVQMAIQLAIYRLLGKQVGTYEATQVRPYLHGRTETTRTISPDSAAFVKRMGTRANFCDDVPSRVEKKAYLRKAVETHMNYITKAAKGHGVDRHFLGLSMMVDGGEQMPELYSDPLFVRSKTWRVSTSNLSHPRFDNWGFGEVVSNGVGIGYAIKRRSCVFNITALKENRWTEKLCHLLEEALIEMEFINSDDQTHISRL